MVFNACSRIDLDASKPDGATGKRDREQRCMHLLAPRGGRGRPQVGRSGRHVRFEGVRHDTAADDGGQIKSRPSVSRTAHLPRLAIETGVG
jgi:hypothetical protein